MINIVQNEQARSNFPIKNFLDPLYDTKVFRMADRLLKSYNGGYWEYAYYSKPDSENMDDMTPFMFPRIDTNGKVFMLVNPFMGYEFQVDAKLAGMIITNYALLQTIETTAKEELYEAWWKLRNAIYDYAEETDQTNQAFGMMD